MIKYNLLLYLLTPYLIIKVIINAIKRKNGVSFILQRLGLSKIKKNLNEMQTLAKKFSSEFYIVIYPWAETLEYGQKQFNWSEFGNDLCSIKECKLIDAIPEGKLEDIKRHLESKGMKVE